ncbi:MAG: DNA helicase RecQ [Woeseiaceae bacterium]
MTASARSVLQKTFGYDEFRPLQQAVVDSVLEGRDALVILPTGAGKSLCYQLPALMMPGLTIVVSPLIALMQDQVDALAALGVAAAFINSSLAPRARDDVWRRLGAKQVKLLYLAPEQLAVSQTRERLKALKGGVSMIAIDEAHCVSQWGHDFRPDYRLLGDFSRLFPTAVRIGLTATATRDTRDDIVTQLELRDPSRIVGDFDRPNIRYAVQPKTQPRQQLTAFLKGRQDQAGIVYCLSRKKVEATSEWLIDQGWSAAPYHAGLPDDLRRSTQRNFLRGEINVVVATIAFGMGIDKPDVRFVVHLDLPKSMEAYYQETGRAGRDGLASDAWMLYGMQDVVRLRQMIDDEQGSDQHVRANRRRLDTLLGWGETVGCRRAPLLRYFDEQHHDDCGHCDNCELPPPVWEASEAARQFLSAIYRTGQRFGAAHIIDVLRGQSVARVKQFGHDQLNVFGIGEALSAASWRSLARQLVAADLVAIDPTYGGLLLRESCRSLLRGDQTFQARKDVAGKAQARKVSAVQTSLDTPQDEELFEALRECRLELAKTEGIPPYRVFHDSTLLQMVRKRPTEDAEFLAISGVGEAKLMNYGDALMAVIAEFDRER